MEPVRSAFVKFIWIAVVFVAIVSSCTEQYTILDASDLQGGEAITNAYLKTGATVSFGPDHATWAADSCIYGRSENGVPLRIPVKDISTVRIRYDTSWMPYVAAFVIVGGIIGIYIAVSILK